MFKVIIAGSRGFFRIDVLRIQCDYYLQNKKDIEIVSGMASGADMLGRRYALENRYGLTEFPANWKEFGKSAGPIRNREMAQYADALIAFWDGKSRGTKNMIEEMKKLGKPVRVMIYDEKRVYNTAIRNGVQQGM